MHCEVCEHWYSNWNDSEKKQISKSRSLSFLLSSLGTTRESRRQKTSMSSKICGACLVKILKTGRLPAKVLDRLRQAVEATA